MRIGLANEELVATARAGARPEARGARAGGSGTGSRLRIAPCEASPAAAPLLVPRAGAGEVAWGLLVVATPLLLWALFVAATVPLPRW